MPFFNPCNFCNGRCCESFVITVDAFDVARIEKETGRKAGEFAELRRLDILSYEEDAVVEARNGKYTEYYLLALKSHPCCFLVDGKCKIYSSRPLACRIYPFREDRKISKRAICPIVSKTGFLFFSPSKKLIEQYENEKKEYARIVKECNEKKLEKEEAFRFIIQRAKQMI
ncbi:MAG: YkgJ family cysteine cluster protein [Candidatus Anstonellales archaeon]